MSGFVKSQYPAGFTFNSCFVKVDGLKSDDVSSEDVFEGLALRLVAMTSLPVSKSSISRFLVSGLFLSIQGEVIFLCIHR